MEEVQKMHANVTRNLCANDIHSLRKLAHAIYRDFLAVKIENFQLKIFDIFSYFCSKHRLWVRVRTASPSNEYPQSMFRVKIRKIGIPLHTPILLYKIGV